MQTCTGQEVIIAVALKPKFSHLQVFVCHHFFESNGKNSRHWHHADAHVIQPPPLKGSSKWNFGSISRPGADKII